DAGPGATALADLEGSIPASGVHYAFEKLYANQPGRPAWFAIGYASAAGAAAARFTSVFGALFFWLGLGLYFPLDPPLPALSPSASLGVSAGGLVVVLASVATNHLALWPAVVVSLAVIVGLAALNGLRLLEIGSRAVRPAE